MNKGICHLTFIPIRQNPESASEQISQLIFGEKYEVIDRVQGWVRIRNDFDGYEGWISQSQYKEDDQFSEDSFVLAIKYVEQNGHLIPCGAQGQQAFPHQSEEFSPMAICSLAVTFLNTPYLWGGRTFMGIDCSGYIQVLFKAFGIQLPRDSKDQAEFGELIPFGFRSPGDVAFFANESGKIIHTGLLLDQNRIIHAHGWVRIDTLNSEGIYQENSGKYSHKLSHIRRFSS